MTYRWIEPDSIHEFADLYKCCSVLILGDPGADSGGEGKSKRAEKYIWNEEK